MSVANAIERLIIFAGEIGHDARHSLQRGMVGRAMANELKRFAAAGEELSQHDHEVIDHSVDFLIRAADYYLTAGGNVDHNEERDALLDAVAGAARSKVGSHGYNVIAGKPVSREDDMIKQMVIAGVKACHSLLQQH